MSDDKEVNPQSGTEEVSPVAAQEPKRRGRGTNLSSLTPEELKEHKQGCELRFRFIDRTQQV